MRAEGYTALNATGLERITMQKRLPRLSYNRQVKEVVMNGSRPPKAGEPLTNREFEVLDELKRGGQNQRVAYELGISTRTVDGHISAILIKLDTDNRIVAVYRGLKQGIIY